MVSTDSAGIPLSDTDAVTINVNADNDAPVNKIPGAQSVNEDTVLAIDLGVNDVDNNLATSQLTVGNGTLTVKVKVTLVGRSGQRCINLCLRTG